MSWNKEQYAPSLNWFDVAIDFGGTNIITTVGNPGGGQIFINNRTNAPSYAPTPKSRDESGTNSDGAIGAGAIVGIVLGGVAFIIAIIAVVYCFYENKREEEELAGGVHPMKQFSESAGLVDHSVSSSGDKTLSMRAPPTPEQYQARMSMRSHQGKGPSVGKNNL